MKLKSTVLFHASLALLKNLKDNFLKTKNYYALRLITPYWPSILGASVCALLIGIIAPVLTALVGPATKVLFDSQLDDTLNLTQLFGHRLSYWLNQTGLELTMTGAEFVNILPWLLMTLAGGKAIFSMTQWLLWERLSEKVAYTLRQNLIDNFLCINPQTRLWRDNRQQEEKLSAAMATDIRFLREYIVHFYGGLPREGIQSIFLTFLLYTLSPKLFLIFIVGILPVILLMNRYGKLIRRRADRALENYADLTEWLQQRLLGIETIKQNNNEALEIANMRQKNHDIFWRFYKAARIKARTSPSIQAIAVAALAVIVWVVLHDIQANEQSGSVSLSFFATLGLLSQSTAKLGRYFNANREASAAMERLMMLTNYLEKNRWHKNDDSRNIEIDNSSEPMITCVNLKVKYPEAQEWALNNFSYQFTAGHFYCLAGPSGSGKSTLMKAILGLVPIQSGDLKICYPQWQGLALCYLPQMPLLFPGTVAENVCYPDKDYDQARIHASLSQAQASKFVEALPQKELTYLGPGGASLSGGQAQRIHLARLYYHASPIILVDEGTSALDPDLEKLINDSLDRLAQQGRLVLMIAHRTSAQKRATFTLYLKNGQLDESY